MDNPLATPERNSDVLRRFLANFRIDPSLPPPTLLGQVGQAFGRLPYENLTKILKDAKTGNVEHARRHPTEVIADHVRHGTGGTCFALTATLLHLVRSLGWEAQPILADRPYGANTHCALLVWVNGQAHLLDPGFLIDRPLALPQEGAVKVATSFNEVTLTPTASGKVELHTHQQGRKTHRLTFHQGPADASEFLRAWDASFDWDMMHYPVLTRVVGGSQVYLRDQFLQVRERSAVRKEQINPAELADLIARQFGIDAAIAREALAILQRDKIHQ